MLSLTGLSNPIPLWEGFLNHVDGDHTTAGAIHDMTISFAALSPGGIMLVDDYDYLKEVRKAADKYRADNPHIHTEYRKSLRGEILFRKD